MALRCWTCAVGPALSRLDTIASLVKDELVLKAVDATILPEAPSVPTNLTVIMVAEHIYRHALSR